MKDADDVVRDVRHEVAIAAGALERAVILLEEVPFPSDLVRRLERLSREVTLAWNEVAAEMGS